MPEPSALSYPLRITDLPTEGRMVTIDADAAARQALAHKLGIPAVDALSAELHVVPEEGGRAIVRGRVLARVTRVCVVTLEDMVEDIDEAVSTVFVPDTTEACGDRRNEVVVDPLEEDVELYAGGTLDLGVLAAEHLALGLSPYPRKPDVRFEAREETSEGGNSPFAALTTLRSKRRQDE